MAGSPKVSVIVPNFNHARFLRQRLDSVFHQTYQDFEVILLDDASTDNSVDILSEYASDQRTSHFIVNSQNSGSPFRQWAKGIALAKGKYIWIAESDDWADLKFLEKLVPYLENTAKLGIVFSGSHWVNDLGKICKDLSIYQEDFNRSGVDEIKHELVFRNTIQNASSAILRKSAIDLNCFPVNLLSCGDWILYVRILMSHNIQYVSES